MDLARLVRSLRKKRKPLKVLVTGDLILDRWVWGEVERISPEAPVPVLDLKGETFSLGGAANVAANLRALGAEVELAGLVGGDLERDRFLSLCRETGIGSSGIAVDDKRPTTTKTRVIGHNQQIVRIDRETRSPAGHDLAGKLCQTVSKMIDGLNAVVLSDYGKGVLTDGFLDGMRSIVRGRDLPIVVDPKNPHFHVYRDFTVLTPNVHEAATGAGIKVKDEPSLVEAGFKIRASLNLRAVLVTRGPQGMSLFERGRDVVHIPTVARNVYDVTGAGDTVAATMALALGAGYSLEEGAHLANHAAGVVVGKFGTATLTLPELEAAIRA
jgi:D-beta-D-heptose 7-phosphate kinase/D-beta-D-heptose 1-phosphate adenosyltransferase